MIPVQVLRRRQQLLIDQDIEGFAELFAADGVIEIPFAGPELPPRLEGRTVIAEFSRRTATGKSFTTPSIQVFRIRDGQILLFRDYTGPPAESGHPAA